MEHKNILFDDILQPTKTAIAEKKALKKNRFNFFFFGIIKWIFLICVSLIGSLALSALVTAIIQERNIADVVVEFFNKLSNFVQK